jgi:nucleotide-binding universal stress UspA family protein
MGDIRKIMVLALEIRESRQAVHRAVSLAKQTGAGLYILHVEHNPFGEQGWNLPFLSLDDAYLELVKASRKELAELLYAEKADGLPVQEIVARDAPLTAIRKAVEREGIDLLVVPAHAESRLEHFLFGEVNEVILRTLPCSVLFLKEEPDE